MEIKILHTMDIHSNYENFSKVVSKIKELKDEQTIVLDAGDFADFKRMELLGTRGQAAVDLLENAGYDAISIGNNETFNGINTLKEMAASSEVPFLSCNLYRLNGGEIKGIKRSIILDKEIKVLIIGTSPDLGEFSSLFNFEFRNYLDAVREEINRNRDNYDLCILLSHLGLDFDKKIAHEIEGIDIIISGHFHLLIEEPEIVNNTIIHASGCFGEKLGLLRVETGNEKINLIEARNIDVNDCIPSDDIINILHKNKERAVDNLSKPLYDIDFDLWHDVVEENPITNLLADALVDVLDCDIGIINSGVISGGIKKGSVSEKKLLEICPSPLNPTYFEIKGRYLREALQKSLDSEVCLSDGMGAGFRGKYLGRLHVSNARIEHDSKKIINIFINGEKLVDEQYYSVATSDYLQRGTGYQSLKNNRNEKYNKEFLRDTLRDYIAKEEFVRMAFDDRWVVNGK